MLKSRYYLLSIHFALIFIRHFEEKRREIYFKTDFSLASRVPNDKKFILKNSR